MTCDDGRPCQRCIKRQIAHLCRDDRQATSLPATVAASSNTKSSAPPPQPRTGHHSSSHNTSSGSSSDTSSATSPPPEIPITSITTSTTTAAKVEESEAEFPALIVQPPPPLGGSPGMFTPQQQVPVAQPLVDTFAYDPTPFPGMSAFPFSFASESMGHEFAIISDFLANWDGATGSPPQPAPLPYAEYSLQSQHQEQQQHPLQYQTQNPQQSSSAPPQQPHPPHPQPQTTLQQQQHQQQQQQQQQQQHHQQQQQQQPTERLSSTERFIFAAADPSDIGSSEDRLQSVIRAKFDAGLLKPHNYVNGYTVLQRWMDKHMSPAGRARVLAVLGTFRPTFRLVAQSLTDYDLVMVEEAFERLLLDYDRVFSAMGIPSALWRRDGQIHRANKEFAQLVGLPVEQLRDGKTCIYELMTEDSAVNYWEKYGDVAFDPAQKAVLTSCVLVDRGGGGGTSSSSSTGSSGSATSSAGEPTTNNTTTSTKRPTRPPAPCCFSFTIRRDRYNIPLLIAGNFLVA
ncbi:hypothetical protein HDU90_003620 [Geranomyces variabilis]|nr:hypothetical protein HDU90_003620 [Geranomyces variabilis]